METFIKLFRLHCMCLGEYPTYDEFNDSLISCINARGNSQ